MGDKLGLCLPPAYTYINI